MNQGIFNSLQSFFCGAKAGPFLRWLSLFPVMGLVVYSGFAQAAPSHESDARDVCNGDAFQTYRQHPIHSLDSIDYTCNCCPTITDVNEYADQ